MNNDLRIKIKVDKDTGELIVATKEFEKLGNTITKSSKETEKFQNRIKFMGHVTAGIYAVNKAYDVLNATIGDFVKKGIQVNAEMQHLTIGLASLNVATSKNIDAYGNSLTYQDKFNLSLRESSQTMDDLLKINAKTPHSLNQTIQIYKAMYVGMRNIGASSEDMLDLTQSLSIAAGSAGVDFNAMLSAMDGLATGTVETASEMGRFLKAIGLSNEEIKNSNDVLGLFKDNLKDFKAVDTYNTRVSNLSNSFSMLTKEIMEVPFEAISERLNPVSEFLDKLTRSSHRVKVQFSDVKDLEDKNDLLYKQKLLLAEISRVKNDKFMWDADQKKQLKELNDAYKLLVLKLDQIVMNSGNVTQSAYDSTEALKKANEVLDPYSIQVEAVNNKWLTHFNLMTKDGQDTTTILKAWNKELVDLGKTLNEYDFDKAWTASENEDRLKQFEEEKRIKKEQADFDKAWIESENEDRLKEIALIREKESAIASVNELLMSDAEKINAKYIKLYETAYGSLTPEQQKAFVENWGKALEDAEKDTSTLKFNETIASQLGNSMSDTIVNVFDGDADVKDAIQSFSQGIGSALTSQISASLAQSLMQNASIGLAGAGVIGLGALAVSSLISEFDKQSEESTKKRAELEAKLLEERIASASFSIGVNIEDYDGNFDNFIEGLDSAAQKLYDFGNDGSAFAEKLQSLYNTKKSQESDLASKQGEIDSWTNNASSRTTRDAWSDFRDGTLEVIGVLNESAKETPSGDTGIAGNDNINLQGYTDPTVSQSINTISSSDPLAISKQLAKEEEDWKNSVIQGLEDDKSDIQDAIAQTLSDISELVRDNIKEILDFSDLDIDTQRSKLGDFDLTVYSNTLNRINEIGLAIKDAGGEITPSQQSALEDLFLVPEFITGQNYESAVNKQLERNKSLQDELDLLEASTPEEKLKIERAQILSDFVNQDNIDLQNRIWILEETTKAEQDRIKSLIDYNKLLTNSQNSFDDLISNVIDGLDSAKDSFEGIGDSLQSIINNIFEDNKDFNQNAYNDTLSSIWQTQELLKNDVQNTELMKQYTTQVSALGGYAKNYLNPENFSSAEQYNLQRAIVSNQISELDSTNDVYSALLEQLLTQANESYISQRATETGILSIDKTTTDGIETTVIADGEVIKALSVGEIPISIGDSDKDVVSKLAGLEGATVIATVEADVTGFEEYFDENKSMTIDLATGEVPEFLKSLGDGKYTLNLDTNNDGSTDFGLEFDANGNLVSAFESSGLAKDSTTASITTSLDALNTTLVDQREKDRTRLSADTFSSVDTLGLMEKLDLAKITGLDYNSNELTQLAYDLQNASDGNNDYTDFTKLISSSNNLEYIKKLNESGNLTSEIIDSNIAYGTNIYDTKYKAAEDAYNLAKDNYINEYAVPKREYDSLLRELNQLTSSGYTPALNDPTYQQILQLEKDVKVAQETLPTDSEIQALLNAYNEAYRPYNTLRNQSFENFTAFSNGGFTPDIGKYTPAGVVHGGEYVAPMEQVKQYPELFSFLDSTRGYADGGLVNTTIPISNNLDFINIIKELRDEVKSLKTELTAVKEINKNIEHNTGESYKLVEKDHYDPDPIEVKVVAS